MSIYAQLLGNALGQAHSHERSTAGDALAQVVAHRHRLKANVSSYPVSDRAPAAVADQLAYDVALIELSQLLGIEVDLSKFGQPRQERARLEGELESRGIDLDEFGNATEMIEQSQSAWGRR